MPWKQTPLAELGSVEPHSDGYRAHLQYRDEAGTKKNTYGPDRRDRSRAEADLAQIRAAGAVGNTRERGLQIMSAERRLQVSASFEAEVRVAVQRQRAAEDEEEAAVYLSDEEPEEDEPWLLDYPSPRTDDVRATPPSQKQPLTPHEADVELQAFRPIKARPEDLEHLLACQADPNKPITTPGGISPLQNVLTFAREGHVAKMRQLLLDAGANESDEDGKDWVTRQRADFRESMFAQARLKRKPHPLLSEYGAVSRHNQKRQPMLDH